VVPTPSEAEPQQTTSETTRGRPQRKGSKISITKIVKNNEPAQKQKKTVGNNEVVSKKETQTKTQERKAKDKANTNVQPTSPKKATSIIRSSSVDKTQGTSKNVHFETIIPEDENNKSSESENDSTHTEDGSTTEYTDVDSDDDIGPLLINQFIPPRKETPGKKTTKAAASMATVRQELKEKDKSRRQDIKSLLADSKEKEARWEQQRLELVAMINEQKENMAKTREHVARQEKTIQLLSSTRPTVTSNASTDDETITQTILRTSQKRPSDSVLEDHLAKKKPLQTTDDLYDLLLGNTIKMPVPNVPFRQPYQNETYKGNNDVCQVNDLTKKRVLDKFC